MRVFCGLCGNTMRSSSTDKYSAHLTVREALHQLWDRELLGVDVWGDHSGGTLGATKLWKDNFQISQMYRRSWRLSKARKEKECWKQSKTLDIAHKVGEGYCKKKEAVLSVGKDNMTLTFSEDVPTQIKKDNTTQPFSERRRSGSSWKRKHNPDLSWRRSGENEKARSLSYPTLRHMIYQTERG